MWLHLYHIEFIYRYRKCPRRIVSDTFPEKKGNIKIADKNSFKNSKSDLLQLFFGLYHILALFPWLGLHQFKQAVFIYLWNLQISRLKTKSVSSSLTLSRNGPLVNKLFLIGTMKFVLKRPGINEDQVDFSSVKFGQALPINWPGSQSVLFQFFLSLIRLVSFGFIFNDIKFYKNLKLYGFLNLLFFYLCSKFIPR